MGRWNSSPQFFRILEDIKTAGDAEQIFLRGHRPALYTRGGQGRRQSGPFTAGTRVVGHVNISDFFRSTRKMTAEQIYRQVNILIQNCSENRDMLLLRDMYVGFFTAKYAQRKQGAELFVFLD